jgi:hypothetical protein
LFTRPEQHENLSDPHPRTDSMPTFEELDQLSSKELHDRAVHLAEKRIDVAFLWRLLETIPAAEAASGETGGADVDIARVSGLVGDATESGKGPLADALRPLYIDYLLKHAT